MGRAHKTAYTYNPSFAGVSRRGRGGELWLCHKTPGDRGFMTASLPPPQGGETFFYAFKKNTPFLKKGWPHFKGVIIA